MPVKEFKENMFETMSTAKGVVKKTPLMAFSRPKRSGIIALSIDPTDRLVEVRVTDGQQHVLLVSAQGQCIRFEEGDIRPMGRTARGVAGMKLSPGDAVIGMTVVSPKQAGAQILTVTRNGYGKRTNI